MALEVYVGPLARYYAGEWENVADRTGQGPAAGRAGGRAPRGREAERILHAVLAWRDNLGASLGGRAGRAAQPPETPLEVPLDWDERLDAPYFTGRPGWDGFGSLVLWAAYVEHPSLAAPADLPEEWDNDPALLRSNAEGFRSRYSHLVRNVELWLPAAFAFTFEGEDVDGRRVVIGSATTLARQLAELNAATWKAGDADLATWARRPPAPSRATLELRARYAYAVLMGLARRAVEHRLPMKLDF
jgi:hypothetical protein